jgi:TolB-like protein
VMFSRRPQTVDPQSLGTVARGNLVETSAEPEHATYVVSGTSDAAGQQVIVPVTLTYR